MAKTDLTAARLRELLVLDEAAGVFKERHLGIFETPVAAHDAYLEAKRRLHAGCTI
jgi:hypothetical protein